MEEVIIMDFTEFIKPELLIVAAVLYVLGLMIKQTEKINDKYIPIILGVVGVILSLVYVIATEGLVLMGIFTAVTQGILVAGVAVYVNQLIKQAGE